MRFNRYDIRFGLKNTSLDVQILQGLDVVVINDSSKKRCANIDRTSTNYYIVYACDYNNFIISSLKFNSLTAAVNHLRSWFNSPGDCHKIV